MWLIGLIASVAVLASVAKCSPGTTVRTPAEVAATDPMVVGLNSAVAAQSPPALEPLNDASVRTGFADMNTSFAAEGLSGAMIYSQNCYEALSRSFSWRRLDVCGAADVKAVATVPEEDVPELAKEIAYFQSEVAAARYLGAATGGGTSTENADARLEKMQARLPVSKARSDPSNGVENEASGNSTSDDGSNIGAVDEGFEVVT